MDMLIFPPQDQVGGPDGTQSEESHSIVFDKDGVSSKLLHFCSDSGFPVLSKPSEVKEYSSSPGRVASNALTPGA